MGRMAPFFSAASPALCCGSAAETLAPKCMSLFAGQSYWFETKLKLSYNVYLQRQKETLNELANNLIAVIDSAREDWEGEQSAGIMLVLCHAVFGKSCKLGQNRRLFVDQGNLPKVRD